MSYLNIFKEDNKYQDMVKDFTKKKARLELMAEQGIYKKDALKEVSSKIFNDLKTNVTEYHKEALKDVNEQMEQLENKVKRLGIGERESDVKEFELRFKLAEDHELQQMVQDLNTSDLLELKLLQLELKNRNLENEFRQVKHYIILNNLTGLDETEQKKYNQLKEKLSVFSTMGNGSVVIDDTLTPLTTIENELNNTVNKVVNGSTAKNVNFDLFI